MKEPEELLPLLDEQIDLLQQKLSLIEQMGKCVQDGHLAVLAELLRREAALAEGSDAVERRLHQMRRQMAEAAGLPHDRVTLGRLVESLEGPAAMALNDRRERLLLIVQELQEKSAATMRLVRYALEFNNRLLAVLVGTDEGCGTYSPNGAVERNREGTTCEHRV